MAIPIYNAAIRIHLLNYTGLQHFILFKLFSLLRMNRMRQKNGNKTFNFDASYKILRCMDFVTVKIHRSDATYPITTNQSQRHFVMSLLWWP